MEIVTVIAATNLANRFRLYAISSHQLPPVLPKNRPLSGQGSPKQSMRPCFITVLMNSANVLA